jgi:CheY-like chemotaxis protein
MQGQLGLDLARKHLPDLILLDLHLPDLPGWDVLAQLQKTENTRDIPVVVISADATASQISKLMAAGARAYLTKPLDVTEFLQVLEDAISKNPAHEGVPV